MINVRRVIACSIVIVLVTSTALSANDSSVEITPEGLRFTRQASVSLEREDLFISNEKIEVAYLFRNHGNRDIVTDVAFPIPDYDLDPDIPGPDPTFDDFTVEIDGRKVSYETDVRAFAGDKDVTSMLTAKRIDIAGFDGCPLGSAEQRLKAKIGQDLEQFAKLGITDKDGFPRWSVAKTYHWRQRFPVGKTISIRHRYGPRAGEGSFTYEDRNEILKETCLSKRNRRWFKRQIHPGEFFYAKTISYILTTARNWKGPISRFRLTVKKESNEELSACFDRPLKQVRKNHFEVRIDNYLPKQDLKLYFFRKM